MSLSKRILLMLTVFLTAATAGASTSFERDTLGISKIIWNERLRVMQADRIDHGVATYSSYVLSWDRAWIEGRWGFGMGAMYGQGRAAAGDFDGTVDYPDSGDRRFTVYGINPRVIYRHTGQVHFSLVAPLMYRTISWDSEVNSDVKVEARRSLAMTLGPEVRVLLSGDWEVLGSTSLLSANAETYWRIGLQHRL